MELFQAALLGIIQGVTEVLPISSSGHLVLAPWLFSFEDPGLSFDVAIHVGTLVAVIGFFYRDISKVLNGGVSLIKKRDFNDTYQSLFVFLGVATIPGVLAGIFLEGYSESAFRNPLVIAATLFTFALLLFYADRSSSKKRSLESMTLYQSIGIGMSQALAIIPGVSRSGVTMTAGLFGDLKREDAARFSFILSVPIILGAAIFSLRGLDVSELFSTYFLVGLFSSTIAGFLSIRFLLNYIKKHSFNIFVFYRIILAASIVVIYILR